MQFLSPLISTQAGIWLTEPSLQQIWVGFMVDGVANLYFSLWGCWRREKKGECTYGVKVHRVEVCSLTAGKSLKNFSWTWNIAFVPSSMLLIPYDDDETLQEETYRRKEGGERGSTLWGKPERNSRPSILIFHITAEAVANSRRGELKVASTCM